MGTCVLNIYCGGIVKFLAAVRVRLVRVFRCPGTIVGSPGRQSRTLSRQYGTFDAILRSNRASALMIMFVSVFTEETLVPGKNEKSR